MPRRLSAAETIPPGGSFSQPRDTASSRHRLRAGLGFSAAAALPAPGRRRQPDGWRTALQIGVAYGTILAARPASRSSRSHTAKDGGRRISPLARSGTGEGNASPDQSTGCGGREDCRDPEGVDSALAEVCRNGKQNAPANGAFLGCAKHLLGLERFSCCGRFRGTRRK